VDADPAADGTAVFEEHRPFLLNVAYRMLGRVADAEDVVQDTWLRWASADRAEVRRPRAFLTRVATRLALDRLRSVQARRETYAGPWLPEPLPTDLRAGTVPDGAERALLTESVSFAVLVVLESLSPLERAVFVLREAFAFPYEEIAAALGRSTPAVRQLAARARSHVTERTPRYEADPAQQRELTRRFLDAASRGDIDGLLELLAPGARLTGDGGGVAKAPLRTIVTARKVARFTAAIGEAGAQDYEFAFRELNGSPAVVAARGGVPAAVLLLDVAEGRIQHVYIVANPGKLAGLQGS
jgi:RNA polymerase sigma-70 factor, ECF subfamily